MKTYAQIEALENAIKYHGLNLTVHLVFNTDKRVKHDKFFFSNNGRTSREFTYDEANAFISGLVDQWKLK